MYRVLARKWRPQTFAELVGQHHVSKTLINAIAADRLAHAYIFAGLRGTGKTTVARILAKCLNCEQGPTTEPCGKCAPCTEIAESRAIDVLEIDAASRTKVEQTRELLEVVSYAPVRDRYKILIIDEAHMLSKASFNALLKTLEEPPPNVLFALATTELQKILPTVLSRCQVFEFRRVSGGEVTDHLRRICEDEGAKVSDAALERVARAGEGSVRDSLSVLERVFAFCGLEADDEDVLRMLGAVRVETLEEWIAALAARDAAGMLGVLDRLVDEGHDLVHFWAELIGALRDLMLIRSIPDPQDILGRSADESRRLAVASGELSLEDLTRAFQLLADLEVGLRGSSRPRFLFEAAMVRLASLGSVRPIEEFLGTLDGEAPAPERKPVQKKKVAAPADAPRGSGPPRRPVSPAPSEAMGIEGLSAAIHEARPMVGAMLDQATAVELIGDQLVIRLPEDQQVVHRHLQQRDTRTLLERVASRLAGTAVTLQIRLAGDPPGAAGDAAPEPGIEPPPQAGSAPAADAGGGLLERARAEPGVQQLLDTFDARVLDIRRNDTPAE